MRSVAIVVAGVLGVFSPACGQGPTGAYLDLAFERSGLPGYNATIASVVVLDADSSAAWLGAERAGLSAAAAPAIEGALDVCRVETGVGSSVTTLHLLDPGLSHLKGPSGEQLLGATPPLFGDGTGYTANFQADEIPVQPGGAYEVRSDGAEAPAFTVNYTAPADFAVEQLGFITPGPGTAVFPSSADLSITWAPDSDDDMYLVFTAGESRVVCRVKDDGNAVIKAKYLQKLPLGPALLEVERSRLIDLGIVAGSVGKLKGQGRIAVRYSYVSELQ